MHGTQKGTSYLLKLEIHTVVSCQGQPVLLTSLDMTPVSGPTSSNFHHFSADHSGNHVYNIWSFMEQSRHRLKGKTPGGQVWLVETSLPTSGLSSHRPWVIWSPPSECHGRNSYRPMTLDLSTLPLAEQCRGQLSILTMLECISCFKCQFYFFKEKTTVCGAYLQAGAFGSQKRALESLPHINLFCFLPVLGSRGSHTLSLKIPEMFASTFLLCYASLLRVLWGQACFLVSLYAMAAAVLTFASLRSNAADNLTSVSACFYTQM